MSGSQITKKLVVFGGNGFLGKRICQLGVQRGHLVQSVSGSGKKPKAYVNEDNEWMEQVQWNKGNVFEPSTYRHLLRDADAVVSTIGILLENDKYKEVVSSGDGIIGAVQGLFKTGNPMARKPEHSVNETIDQTYERYNRDSAIIAAETLIESSQTKETPAFVYISADRGFPGIPHGYIDSKREAELELYQLQPAIRPVIMRPGFMFDKSEAKSHSIRAKIKSTLDSVNSLNDNVLRHALDGIVRPTISTETVAKWCLDRAFDNSFHGPVLLDEMINLHKP